MRILVAGKGGTGKTSIAAMLAHVLADNGYNVLALDTDSVPNLAQSLGVPADEASSIVPLVLNERLVEERTGARPGEGWGVLFSLTPRVDDIAERYGVAVRPNLKLVVVGSINASRQGCLCPAIALARAFLRHVLLRERDVVIVDAEAGAEAFGRGLAEYFDLMLCISEVTVKSISVSLKLVELARQLEIRENVIVLNKVTDYTRASALYRKVVGERIPFHVVRYDENLVRLEYEGKPVTELSEDSPFRVDVTRLAQALIPGFR